MTWDPVQASILIVDDEESLRLTFQMFLQREGYGTVLSAETYDQALALIGSRRFDLVISDIIMAGSSGIDLLRRIRELGYECPVVMVTGYPNVESAAEAVRLGAFDYLAKPVKKSDLLRTARMALQQYFASQESKQLQRENERYRQYLETVFRSVRDMIICIDPDGRIAQMNERAQDWLSACVSGICPGGHIGELPTWLDPLRRDVQLVLDSGEEVSEHRLELHHTDGSSPVLRLSVAPLRLAAQAELLGVVAVFRDIGSVDEGNVSGKRSTFHRLRGFSPVMQTLYTLIENVGPAEVTVLITGESGTGKELVAEALHGESHRRDMPFIKFDCTAIPENLMESELFGHKKGSFTGADRNRQGRILQADGGTLFLDEIGDISPMMQLRLLRFLQEKTFYPVGEDNPVTVNVRVLAATNADLRARVRAGLFREDLYYRLRVVDIAVPPLRERGADLALLAQMFIERFSSRLGKLISGLSDQALAMLQAYSWPGNVREFEHVMERACVLCGAEAITVSDLPEEIRNEEPATQLPQDTNSLNQGIAGLEKEGEEERIRRVLQQTDGNKAKAARLLGMDRSTLYRKMKALNLEEAF
ncbi:MAG: sigma-54-dependent Fis family transcriptional regulator [Desulfobulbaceae bacterium A2]|nr:MAG: sigma-54-dependent Fis family transcriptional regulator [Desulfobulbaceae bacterium A2]